MKRAIILISFLLVNSLLLSIPINAQTDLNFSIIDNELFNSSTDSLSRFNLRNETNYDGNYNGTYSFNNGLPANFTLDDEGGYFQINESLNFHTNNLECVDFNGSGIILSVNTTKTLVNGTIEFYFLTNESNYVNSIRLHDSNGDYVIHMRVDSGTLEYRDSAWHPIIASFQENLWYHFRIDWECSNGGYHGLSTDKWRVYINSILFGDYSFRDNANRDNVFTFQAGTSSTDQDYYFMFDAIGFNSKLEYDIGDNYISNQTILNSLEVNKFEFAFEGFNNPYDSGDQDPSGWTSIDDTNSFSEIREWDNHYDYYYIYARMNDDAGIEKNNFAYNGTFLEISFTLYIDFLGDPPEANYIEIQSSHFTTITLLKINYSHVLSYYDGSDYIEITSDIELDTWYTIDLFINYAIDTCTLNLYNGSIFVDSLEFPLIETLEEGLGKISFNIDSQGGFLTTWLDSIGVIGDGDSLASEELFGYVYYNAGLTYSSQRIHNLIFITASSNFSIGCVSGDYSIGETYVEYRDFFNYTGKNKKYNIYEDYTSIVSNPTLILTINANTTFNPNMNLEIQGVSLEQGSNEYFLHYSYANITTNQSYFYATNNRLRFTLNASKQGLEYIKGYFDINNFQSENYSLVFQSYITGGGTGWFVVNHTDLTSLAIGFPEHLSTNSLLLSQERTVEGLYLYISDSNSVNGTITGYITNLKMRYIPNLPYTITAMSLISLVVPIVVILVPTLAFYYKLGKNSVVPVFLLMSVIALVTTLIDTWLFFIIILASTGFLFYKEDEKR